MIRRFQLLAALLLPGVICAESVTKAPDPVFENISVSDGLSHNTVQKIFQDCEGFMYFATKDGLCRYDGYDYKVYRESIGRNSISNSKVRCISEDQDHRIWAGTDNGLNCIDRVDGSVSSFLCDDEPELKGNRINDLYFEPGGRILWIATDKGVSLYDTVHGSFIPSPQHPAFGMETNVLCGCPDHDCVYIGTHNGLFRCGMDLTGPETIPLASGGRINILSILCDSEDRIWLGSNLAMLARVSEESGMIELLPCGEPFSGDSSNVNSIVEVGDMLWLVTKRDGISFYDRKNGTLCQANALEDESDERLMLTCGYKDRNGNIWVGTYYKGVYFHSCFLNHFHLNPVERPHKQTTGVIGPMVPWKDGIWLGSGDVGITWFRPETGRQVFYDLSENGRPLPECKPMLMHDGLLWVGTESHGIRLVEPASGRIVREYSTFSRYGPLPGNRVNFALEDSSGRIWIGVNGGQGGICLFDEKDETFRTILPKDASLSVKDAFCMSEVGEGIFYVGTRNSGLYRYDSVNDTFSSIPVDGRKDLSVCCIYMDDRQRLWVGTFGQGLVCMNLDGEVEGIYDFTDSGLSNNICGVLQDSSGRIWISSFNGVAYYDEKSGKFVACGPYNGFPQHHIKPSSCLYHDDGMMYFGGESGVVSFNPAEIMPMNSNAPKPVLTDLLIHNRPADVSLRQGIFIDRTVTLKYYDDNITFVFAAINYVYPGKNLCRYMLEGIDNEWSAPVSDRQVTYTNVPAGNYSFLLSVSNGNGEWSEPVNLLDVHIRRAPWNTWWAYLLYCIAGLSILVAFMYYQNTKIQLEHSLQIKSIEKDNLNRMHRFRLDLFTNFSHEIRTPLTLVSGSVTDLIERCPDDERTALDSIRRNVDKMMELVNQLMDFRKQDSGRMELRASCNDFVPFVRDMGMVFSELSKIQNRHIEYDLPEGPLEIWYNPQLMEKVFYNVLINAFKYSDEESTIRIGVEVIGMEGSRYAGRTDRTVSEAVLTTISDKGNKIPEGEIEEIFEPFYRLKSDEGRPGTGIGLSFNRMIMRLHHGDIWAENTDDGVAFRFILPVGSEHLQAGEMSEEKCDTSVLAVQDEEPSQERTEPRQTGYDEKRTILIVEDNDEVRKYLKDKLSAIFNIVDCANGNDALELLNKIETDLVISDVMMPVMDGVELCRRIKSNPEINHIPVILLTAHVSDPHVKAGLEAGADDYIFKPFKFDILLARVRNLIDNNERQRLYFQKKVSPDDLNVKVKDYDEDFLRKCYDFLNEHLDDPDLTIEDFGEYLGISRVHLYRKIKYMTDLSPSRFILNLRLKIAAEMLSKDGVAVSDVCYRVGFNNLSYFTKCFKETYGVTPSKYRSKQ
ncbi:MAG: two-component regulator propeller domain-containing protein [Candidatus Cryptobacteroides sp.]